MKSIISFAIVIIILSSFTDSEKNTNIVNYRNEISQYGITWTFEKPVKSGQFITGDWWVIGPVKIIKIDPAPGPVKVDNNNPELNRWGDTSMKTDTLMRNGSMIVYKAGY